MIVLPSCFPSRDAKSGELGESVRANFSPACANSWSIRRFTLLLGVFYANLSPFFVNIRHFALLLVFCTKFGANFLVAKIASVLICTLFACLLPSWFLKTYNHTLHESRSLPVQRVFTCGEDIEPNNVQVFHQLENQNHNHSFR